MYVVLKLLLIFLWFIEGVTGCQSCCSVPSTIFISCCEKQIHAAGFLSIFSELTCMNECKIMAIFVFEIEDLSYIICPTSSPSNCHEMLFETLKCVVNDIYPYHFIDLKEVWFWMSLWYQKFMCWVHLTISVLLKWKLRVGYMHWWMIRSIDNPSNVSLFFKYMSHCWEFFSHKSNIWTFITLMLSPLYIYAHAIGIKCILDIVKNKCHIVISLSFQRQS